MPIENLNLRDTAQIKKIYTKLNIHSYIFRAIPLSMPINQCHNFFKDS